MPPRSARVASVLLVVVQGLLISALVAGCSKKPLGLDGFHRNEAPETQLTYAPLEADTTSFRVHLYWNGYDSDGEVALFRFAVDEDTSNALAQWPSTAANDTVLTLNVDPATLTGRHAFWITAQDNEGRIDPTPAKRIFSVRTEPPVSKIISGPPNGAITGTGVSFAWEAHDPDGGRLGGWTSIGSFEYMLLKPDSAAEAGHPPLPRLTLDYVRLINSAVGSTLPAPYDDWKWIRTSESSHRFRGLSGGYYVLALRAIDAAGAHDASLALGTNIRYFHVGTEGIIVPSSPPLENALYRTMTPPSGW
jgi:hypothetical protein